MVHSSQRLVKDSVLSMRYPVRHVHVIFMI